MEEFKKYLEDRIRLMKKDRFEMYKDFPHLYVNSAEITELERLYDILFKN